MWKADTTCVPDGQGSQPAASHQRGDAALNIEDEAKEAGTGCDLPPEPPSLNIVSTQLFHSIGSHDRIEQEPPTTAAMSGTSTETDDDEGILPVLAVVQENMMNLAVGDEDGTLDHRGGSM